MSKKIRHSVDRDGFTLIELLVVIAIIALIVGILAPGLKGFKDHAKKIKQKSNIRNIEIGLELYYDKFQRYPISEYVNVFGSTNNVVCGAQHIAEAMVGRDEQGFDPETKWHEFDEDPDHVYDSDTTTADGKRSMNRRKTPYIEFRHTGAFLLEQMFGPASLAAASFGGKSLLAGDAATVDTDGSKRAPVLTDVFTTRLPGMEVKIGSPIVYFRASTKYTMHRSVPQPGDDFSKWTYNYLDNAWIFKLPHLKDPDNPEKQHRYDPDYIDPDTGEEGKQLFYTAITNKNSSYEKPLNSKTYIIISAGTDGIFGTKDDVTNF